MLEGVGDADNVGATFRCAAAFGVGGVLLGPACADPLYRKAIRTSMAATLRCRSRWPSRGPTCWPRCSSEAGTWWASRRRPNRAPLWEAAAGARHRRTALVFGHEGDGLTRAARARCTHLARIPMTAGVDSLNVAMSVGIALYELPRTPYAETES